MRVHKIGDAHLGKKFEAGVPLHRRGEREAMQFEQFERELLTDCDLNVQMGDIFDKMVVPYTVIAKTVAAYRAALAARPDTTFALLRGNHDADRDLDRVSAFDILCQILEPMGVICAKDEPRTLSFGDYSICLMPWHPVFSAEEMVEKYKPSVFDIDLVCGHYDVVTVDDHFNRCPAKSLQALGVKAIATGHDHLKRIEMVDGVPVEVVGSMQPYSHAEDPEGTLYVTLSLADATDGRDLTNKCVRILLQPGETLDQPIDCLQLTLKRERAEAEEVEADFEAFDLDALFEKAAADVGLGDEFKQLALDKLEAERAARG